MIYNRSGKRQTLFNLLTAGAALAVLNGCGAGGALIGDTTPPTITRVGTGLTTVPSPITKTGGIVTVLVDITDPASVDITSPKVDIKNGSVSLLGGPKSLTLTGTLNRWTYAATLPANTGASNITYTVTVTARDLIGNTVSPDFVVGTVIVPHP